jgi:hypothetical protein
MVIIGRELSSMLINCLFFVDHVPDLNLSILFRIVEDLLCGGFKLLPDEEIDWLSKPQNSPEYSVAIRQKQTPSYNPTDYLA